jgi:hypothetical protein
MQWLNLSVLCFVLERSISRADSIVVRELISYIAGGGEYWREDSPVNVHVTCTVGRRRSDFLLRGGNLYPFSPQMRQEQNEADETARCSRHNRKQEHCQMFNVENDEEVMDAAKARHHSTVVCS